MFLKHNLLEHFKQVAQILRKRKMQARLDPCTFHLFIQSETKEWELLPQFIVRENKKKSYSPEFEESAKFFIGWMPYFNKQWRIAQSKLAFKRVVTKLGLPTPEWSANSEKVMTDVIVKGDVSTFAEGIDGPLRTTEGYQLQ